MKRITTILLVLLLLLSCGCAKEPEPTSIGLPDEMLERPTVSTVPEESTLSEDPAFVQYYDLLSVPVMEKELYSLHYVTGFVFDDPAQIDLYWFFYNGFRTNGSWDSFSPEEYEFLMQQEMPQYTDAQKRTGTQMDTILHALFGTELTDHIHNMPDPDIWFYYEDSDSYFTHHGDFYAPNGIIISAVEYRDDMLVIDYSFENPNAPYWPVLVITPEGYSADAGDMRLTLRKTEDGTWTAVSNQMVSDQEKGAS